MPSVRRSYRLALAAGAVALSSAAVPAAHADTAPICPLGESKVLAEFDTPGGHHTRIAYFSATPTETDVCIQTMDSVQTVIAVTSEVSVLPPEVQSGEAPGGTCAHEIVNITDPVSVQLSAGVDVDGRVVCFAIDGVATTITLSGGTASAVPSAAIWLPANSFVNQWGWCSKYYASYEAHRDAGGRAWRECYQQDNRVG